MNHRQTDQRNLPNYITSSSSLINSKLAKSNQAKKNESESADESSLDNVDTSVIIEETTPNRDSGTNDTGECNVKTDCFPIRFIFDIKTHIIIDRLP